MLKNYDKTLVSKFLNNFDYIILSIPHAAIIDDIELFKGTIIDIVDENAIYHKWALNKSHKYSKLGIEIIF